ncbi:CpsD/CapB family tyrosine-protein kinase [Ureibacillus acetophenoni]|uniref:non-specific protein-tyrosine kinase n=1 Tax=Ureibacillus acetophenoni TaxID=614649 RepID=A0A285U9V6_9BACL|nr:CpsD/CapB family tyrosine-protein kinase [Ureibacillus acetophenoni]SOC38477.1 capsular exopolysaccharide synthesis family protein [Ureibacillus acetophenoni]
MKSKSKNYSSNSGRKLITAKRPQHIISEQFRTIRTNLQFSMPDKDLKTLLITSSIPGEGKSTNAANIAIVFAQEGKRVLLVDADMRKPTLHYTFPMSNSQGLSTILTRQHEFIEAIEVTDVNGLFLIPSGPIPPNPSELLSSKNMELFLETVVQEFDIVIFDAPPVLSVSDALILSNKCDGTLLIVNSGAVDKSDVVKAKASLQASQATILGAVLNNFKLPNSKYYYDMYGYGDKKGKR